MDEATKMNRESRRILTEQGRIIKRFLKDNTIPTTVGQPDSLNNKQYHFNYLRLLGFSIFKTDVGVFHCIFPKGWKKIQMPFKNDWAYLIDNKRRKRAAIFYRVMGIFYKDKKKMMQFSSHINYMPRFRVQVDHIIPYDIEKSNIDAHLSSGMEGRILDTGVPIYVTKPINFITDIKDKKTFKVEEKEIRSKLFSDCEKILNELPDNDNVFLYWQDNPDEKEALNNFFNIIAWEKQKL